MKKEGLDQLLNELHRQYDLFVRSHGDVESIDVEKLPTVAQKRIQSEADKICGISNKIEKIRRELISHNDYPVDVSSRELLDFYKEKFLPGEHHFLKLILPEVWAMDFDFANTRSSEATEHLKLSLIFLLKDISRSAESPNAEFDVEYWACVADDLRGHITSRFFEPDRWEENIQAIEPVTTTRPSGKIPCHARERLREVCRSFVCGNWLSCIAMSRALLEYSIKDRHSKLGIEIFENGTDKKLKRLSQLIELASSSDNRLKDDMEKINEYGNEVMHPVKTKKTTMMLAGKNQALDCVNRLRSVLSILYSDN